ERYNSDNKYRLRLGIGGCPASTVQVTFFTDADEFITRRGNMAADMSRIVRDVPRRGSLWTHDTWLAEDDHRLFAMGVKAGGEYYALAGTLCEAIANRYRRDRMVRADQLVEEAIASLQLRVQAR